MSASGTTHNSLNLSYSTLGEARAAAYYYAQGRQDRAAAGHRGQGRTDLAIEEHDTAAAHAFAVRFGAVFLAYQDGIAGMCPPLQRAYDHWRDHGHCHAPGECPTCGRWVSTPYPDQPTDALLDLIQPLGPAHCGRCNERVHTSATPSSATLATEWDIAYDLCVRASWHRAGVRIDTALALPNAGVMIDALLAAHAALRLDADAVAACQIAALRRFGRSWTAQDFHTVVASFDRRLPSGWSGLALAYLDEHYPDWRHQDKGRVARPDQYPPRRRAVHRAGSPAGPVRVPARTQDPPHHTHTPREPGEQEGPRMTVITRERARREGHPIVAVGDTAWYTPRVERRYGTRAVPVRLFGDGRPVSTVSPLEVTVALMAEAVAEDGTVRPTGQVISVPQDEVGPQVLADYVAAGPEPEAGSWRYRFPPTWGLDLFCPVHGYIHDTPTEVCTGEPVARPALAGDVARLAVPWRWAGSMVTVGDLGVLGGMVGKPITTGTGITFKARTFRDDRVVSCGGGPATIHTPVDELTRTGDTATITVWEWRDGFAHAHNGIDYTVTVAVWDWYPTD
jgi:hypothetical protein